MTTPDERDLDQLDAAARRAADGLRQHVTSHLDPHADVAPLLTATQSRRGPRLVAIAAAIVLLAGTIGVLSARGGDDRTRLDLDEDGGAASGTGVLRPLGPHDGRDSIQLPLTAEPSTGLRDGDVVAVSGAGFVPGERVGIVQCAKEAGGDSPQTRGGVDGCNIGNVTYADADADGLAAGEIRVRRVLTTPLTGSVDCAAEANRCMVAMGALNDYDRSGGHPIEFMPGEPVDLPTVSVTPAEGLADGDLVHLVVDGLTPGSVASLTVCSSDPAACWQTGDEIEEAYQDGEDRYTGIDWGLRVDGNGHAEGDVAVWRFLPGPEPSTYVDCAVSRCSLRVNADPAPPSVPLHFAGGGEGPVAPTLTVEPSTGLAPGDRIVVRGAGFAPGSSVGTSLCASRPDAPPMSYEACTPMDDGGATVAADGTFSVDAEVPDVGSFSSYAEECDANGSCQPVTTSDLVPVRCDGETSSCVVTADAYDASPGGSARPVFMAPGVPVTFR